MPFTMMVMHSRTTTSLTVQILPFTPLGSYSGMLRLFTVFLLEITMLMCTCFQVSPACCYSFLVIVTTKWSMTWVPICTGTLSPYLWPRITKNKTSSLYLGKSCPLKMQQPLSGSILNPYSLQNPSVRADIWDPVSTSAVVSTPTTTTTASLAQPVSHTMGLGLWYWGSATSTFTLTDVPASPLPGCASWGAGWRWSQLPPVSI